MGRKDGVSGAYLALGILLKYMPIVILPFLAFSERRLHLRLLSFCVALVVLGLVVSVLIWGTSTFLPLTFAAKRSSVWSIYYLLASAHAPLKLDTFDWLEKPLLVTAGLGVFAWCAARRTGPALSAALAVSVTLVFYRVGYINYQMVLFVLISYWVVSEWQHLVEHSALVALLGGYFGLLAILEFAAELEDIDNIIMLKVLLGCALLVGLVWFSAIHRRNFSASPSGANL